MVIQGYGNAALSLLLVVLTNLVSIVSTPLFVKIVLGGMEVSLDAVDLLVKMIVSILVPLLVGKGLRELLKPVREFVGKYRVVIYMFTNFQVICIVWETMSSSQEGLLAREAGEIIAACVAAIIQHMAFLVMSSIIAWVASFFFRMKEAERKAFIIMSSQKSLPTAVIIISYMGGGGGAAHTSYPPPLGMNYSSPSMNFTSPSLDIMPPAAMSAHPVDDSSTDSDLDPGLMAIPCIVFYVLQLFIDSFIATGWASKYEKVDSLRAKYAKELDELSKINPDESAVDIGSEISRGPALSKEPTQGARDDDEGVGLLSHEPRH